MPIDKFDFLRSLLARLSLVIMWLTVFVFHLTLFVLALVALWFFQIPPQTLVAQFLAFAQSLHAAIASLIGVSVLTVLVLWVKLWMRIYGAVITPYLFRDIDEARRS
jgi:hypothetical protein